MLRCSGAIYRCTGTMRRFSATLRRFSRVALLTPGPRPERPATARRISPGHRDRAPPRAQRGASQRPASARSGGGEAAGPRARLARRRRRGPGTPPAWGVRRRDTPGQDHVDGHAEFGVPKAFAPREFRDITKTQMFLLEALQPFASQQEIDIYGNPSVAILVEGHGTDDRVRDAVFFQQVRYLGDYTLNVGFAHEEPRRLRRARPEVVLLFTVQSGTLRPRSHFRGPQLHP